MIEGLRDAIDCDVHCAPASFDALFPYLGPYWQEFIGEAGMRLGNFAGAYPPAAPTTATAEARAAEGSAMPATYESLKERVLDRSQPRYAILNCLTLFDSYRNPHYSAALATAVNEWIRNEWLAHDQRLRASLAISPLDPIGAAEEIDRRGDDPQIVQVLLPIRSDLPYGNSFYNPIYEAATRHDLTVGLHAWGRGSSAPTAGGIAATYLQDFVSNSLVAQAQMTSLVSEGTFVRFPQLRVVLLECGISWQPYHLWRFDKDWKGIWRETPWLQERPSEYIRRHMRATIQPPQLPTDETELREAAQLIRPSWMLYASDYPHNHGSAAQRLLDVLDEESTEAVLRTNALEFYRFDR
jgi:predicted TIM-barrel fold metal-dependent hydrolase